MATPKSRKTKGKASPRMSMKTMGWIQMHNLSPPKGRRGLFEEDVIDGTQKRRGFLEADATDGGAAELKQTLSLMEKSKSDPKQNIRLKFAHAFGTSYKGGTSAEDAIKKAALQVIKPTHRKTYLGEVEAHQKKKNVHPADAHRVVFEQWIKRGMQPKS